MEVEHHLFMHQGEGQDTQEEVLTELCGHVLYIGRCGLFVPSKT